MNEIEEECLFCHSKLEKKAPYGDFHNTISYICPTCGIYSKNDYDFQLLKSETEDNEVLYSKIASFLYYNKND